MFFFAVITQLSAVSAHQLAFDQPCGAFPFVTNLPLPPLHPQARGIPSVCGFLADIWATVKGNPGRSAPF